MTQAPKGGETLDTKMSAKELASYEWKGMRDGEDRALFEGSESIKVTVGTESEQKTWYLPKKVLTHCSPFFDAALNGNFVEASSKAVDLPEDDPDAFEIWATWLSLGELENIFNYTSCENDNVRAWKLGDKLACPAFKDRVMFLLVNCFERGAGVCTATIDLAYEGSSPGSKLRQFFIELFVWEKLHGHMAAEADEFIDFLLERPQFLEDTAKHEMKAGTDAIRTPWEERHLYYENPAFEPDDYISRWLDGPIS